MEWLGAIYTFCLGLCLGSFANAVAWRIHQEKDFIRARSECDRCGHTLAWNDLIPLVSWLMLKGQCRYCRQKLSSQHVFFELGVALMAMISFLVWPYGFALPGLGLYIIWLIMLTMLAIMWVYDWRWMLLPSLPNYIFGASGVLFGMVVGVLEQREFFDTLGATILGISSVAGVYYCIYLATARKGVGEGDIILGIGIGAALGWVGGLGVLMLANVIGAIYMLPQLLRRRVGLKTAIPFGPFLMIGFVVMLLWGQPIVTWYQSLWAFSMG